MVRYFTITLLVLFLATDLMHGQNEGAGHLLTINRSRDTDIINYELNIDENGNIDSENPIHIYWLRQTQQNQKEALTWIQNRYAYGIKLVENTNIVENPNSNVVLKFKFVSYNNAILEVRKHTNNSYKLYTVFNNQEMEVSNIYIQFNGGTFWVPIITEVKINGYKPYSNELISAVINP